MTWTVIMSRSKVRIFTPLRGEPKKLTLVEEIRNPIGREKNRSLKTDRPGYSRVRTPSTFGQVGSQKAGSPYQLSGEKNPHEDAAVEFVIEVCRHLSRKFNQNVFDNLIVAAEPHLMGLVKKKMNKNLQRQVSRWINKDLEKMPVNRLATYIEPKRETPDLVE